MKIGVLGGTFNPVHNGHISLAKQLLKLGYIDKLLFVVSARPPHKDEPDTQPEMRYEMVCLALFGQDKILPCDIEIKRQGKSYTIDTIEQIKEEYKQDTIYFITGADMFIDIPFWHRPEALFKSVSFLVADREQAFSDKEYLEKIKNIKKTYSPEVTFIDIVTPDISSSEIRSNVELFKDKIPQKVYEYIKENSLYGNEKDLSTDQKILARLKKKLGEKRLKHTLCVAECAKELALRFGADEEKAYTAGLLHDIEKEDSIENMLRLCDNLCLDDELKSSRALLHGPAAAEYAKKEFLADDEIYSACFYHTTGKENMSKLDKIIYLADYIEETRTQKGVERIRETAKTSLDKAVLEAMDATISYLSQNNMKIYQKTLDARNYLLKNI